MDFPASLAPENKNMSDIQQQDFGYRSRNKIRAKKVSSHIDMTPMVDLAFLLLTFFMLTTSFMKTHSLTITLPVKGPPQPIPQSQTLSILLTGNNRIIWYQGMDDPGSQPQANLADFSSLGSNSIHRVLIEKNKLILAEIQAVRDSVEKGLIRNDAVIIGKHISDIKKSEKKGLIVLIKPDEKSKYKNLVDIFDELMLCQVATYAIVDVSPNETGLIKDFQ